ncbi:MAG: hypothetical protein ABSF99_05035 [Anaerolineales bacterium]|jgi:hypothetical protein
MGIGKKLADASKAKINSLENRLSRTLKPITPRREFVEGLGQRIQVRKPAALVNYINNWHILAMLIASLVSLTVFLGMLARALLALLGKKRAA